MVDEDKIIENIRNLFKLKKEKERMKDRIIRDIKTLFDQEEDYYKPVRVGSFCNNNNVEYKSNDDRNKTLSNKLERHSVNNSDKNSN